MPELKGYNGILDGDNHNLTFNYNLDYLMNFSVFGDVGNNSLLEPYSFEIKNLNIKLNNTSETIKFIYPTLINGNINTLIITNCDFYDFYIKNSITSGSIYVTNCYFKNATQQLMNNANLYISQSEFEYAAFNTNYGFLKLEDCILKCATMSNYKPDNVDWTPLIVATNTTFTDMVVDKNVQGNIQLKNCTYPIIYKTSNDGVINIE